MSLIAEDNTGLNKIYLNLGLKGLFEEAFLRFGQKMPFATARVLLFIQEKAYLFLEKKGLSIAVEKRDGKYTLYVWTQKNRKQMYFGAQLNSTSYFFVGTEFSDGIILLRKAVKFLVKLPYDAGGVNHIQEFQTLKPMIEDLDQLINS